MNNTAIICKKIEATRVQRICCSECGARVPRVGLLEGGVLRGLSIKCRECGFIIRADTAEKGKSDE